MWYNNLQNTHESKNTRDISMSDDLETGAGFLAAGTWSSSAKSVADMLATPDSLPGLPYLGE